MSNRFIALSLTCFLTFQMAWLTQVQAAPDELVDAICSGNLNSMKELLKEKARANAALPDFDMTPLALAFDDPGCGYPIDSLEIANVLIDHGADVNGGGRRNYTPLMAAMAVCQLASVKFLISKGADVNARDFRGRTPLMYISGGINAVPCLKYLVEHGADIHAVAKDGTTAKSWARTVNNKAAEDYLRSAGQ